jgi:hypothetical protein
VDKNAYKNMFTLKQSALSLSCSVNLLTVLIVILQILLLNQRPESNSGLTNILLKSEKQR